MIGGSVFEKTSSGSDRAGLREWAELVVILTYVAFLYTVMPVLLVVDRVRDRIRRTAPAAEPPAERAQL